MKSVMCNRMRRAAMLLILGVFSRLTMAEISEDVDFQYYQINPRSLGDLNREIRRSSGNPLWTGFTRWSITYWYGYQDSGEVCKLTNINVRLDIRYKMPKLFQPNRDLTLKREFERYYSGLMEHEEGHADIARKAAVAVEGMLVEASATRCEDLPQIEKAKYRSILSEYRDMQRRYDLITDHGRWQERWQSR
jgi:predicted secreted Zn-dependent protease